MTGVGRYRALNKKPTPLTFLSNVGGPLTANFGDWPRIDLIQPYEPYLNIHQVLYSIQQQ